MSGPDNSDQIAAMSTITEPDFGPALGLEEAASGEALGDPAPLAEGLPPDGGPPADPLADPGALPDRPTLVDSPASPLAEGAMVAEEAPLIRPYGWGRHPPLQGSLQQGVAEVRANEVRARAEGGGNPALPLTEPAPTWRPLPPDWEGRLREATARFRALQPELAAAVRAPEVEAERAALQRELEELFAEAARCSSNYAELEKAARRGVVEAKELQQGLAGAETMMDQARAAARAPIGGPGGGGGEPQGGGGEGGGEGGAGGGGDGPHDTIPDGHDTIPDVTPADPALGPTVEVSAFDAHPPVSGTTRPGLVAPPPTATPATPTGTTAPERGVPGTVLSADDVAGLRSNPDTPNVVPASRGHTTSDYRWYESEWHDAGGTGPVPEHGFVNSQGRRVAWGPRRRPEEHHRVMEAQEAALLAEPAETPPSRPEATPEGPPPEVAATLEQPAPAAEDGARHALVPAEPSAPRELPRRPGMELTPEQIEESQRAVASVMVNPETPMDTTLAAFAHNRPVMDPDFYEYEWSLVGSGPAPRHGFVGKDGRVVVWSRPMGVDEFRASPAGQAWAAERARIDARGGSSPATSSSTPADPLARTAAAEGAADPLGRTVAADAHGQPAVASGREAIPPSAPVHPDDAVSLVEEASHGVGAGTVVEGVGGVAQAADGLDQLGRARGAWQSGDRAGAIREGTEGALNTASGAASAVGSGMALAGVEGGAAVSAAAAPVAAAATVIALDNAGNEYTRERGTFGDREGVTGTRGVGAPRTGVHRSIDDIADEDGRLVQDLTGSEVLGATAATAERVALIPVAVAQGVRAAGSGIAEAGNEESAARTGRTVDQEVEEDRGLMRDALGERAADTIATGERAALVTARAAQGFAGGIAASGRADTTDIEAADAEARGARETAHPRETRAERSHREAVHAHRQRLHDRDAGDAAAVQAELHDRDADPQNFDPVADQARRDARRARGETVEEHHASFTDVRDAQTAVRDSTAWDNLRDRCAEMKSEEREAIGVVKHGVDDGGEEAITHAVRRLDDLRGRFGHWAELLRRGQSVAAESGHDWWHLARPNLPYWAELCGQIEARARALDIRMSGGAFAAQLRGEFSGLPV